MQVVVLLVCFLLSICATVTSLMAWKGMHEVSATPVAMTAAVPPPILPAARPDTQQLDALSSQVATLRAEVTALKDTVANQAAVGASTTTAPAAVAATVDDAKIKEMIRAEMLNQFRMMRGGGGGGFNQTDPAAIARQLQEQLALDPAKSTQVAALVVAERAAVRAIYQNANGASREELAPKVKDERDKLDVESAKLLSADEQTKLDTWLDRQQVRRQRPDPNANGGNAGNGAAPGGQPAPPGGAATGTSTTPAAGPSSF